MIPKTIHYCWFSDNPYPEKIQRCIESWSRVLPDYKIKIWNRSNFPIGKSRWVDEALREKRYAFAADYIRAYALYTEGGIYLDSDVEVIKSFDPLLNLPYFIGREVKSPIEAAVMGSEKLNPIFGLILSYYDRRSFVDKAGRCDTTPMPYVMISVLEDSYAISYVSDLSEVRAEANSVYILPYDYFSPKSYIDGKLHLTPNTYSIHHFAGSWIKGKASFVIRCQRIFGEKNFERLVYPYLWLKKRIRNR